MPTPIDVPTVVSDLARVLAEPKPMRRGTLTVRYLKCNKPGCLCAQRDNARHGPYTSVVRVVAGRTQSRHVPAERANEMRRQVEAGQQFRKHVEAYWRACEQWADAQLDASATASLEAEKGGSKRPSRPKSQPKSKRS